MGTMEILETKPELGDAMRLISAPLEDSLTITKSEFIAYLAPVNTVDDADRVIRERRALHPHARHHCTALTLGTPVTLQRSNDDGEPGGTAGMPMANALRGRSMTNIVAVVTRYFGGVKLGAGGLTRAYGSAVTEALDAAESRGLLMERTVREVSSLGVGYDIAGPFEAQFRAWADSHAVTVESADYDAAGLALTLVHEPGLEGAIEAAAAEISSGAVQPTRVGFAFVDVPLTR